MSSAAGGSNTGTGGGPRGPKSAAYRSAIAVQTNASKYRNKYKELKKKVREIENENERGGRSISQSREAVDAYVIGEKEKRKAAELAAQQQQQTLADQNGSEAIREGGEDGNAMEVDAAENVSSNTPGPAAANRVKITIKRSAGPNTAA
ncbi:hypothetical protein CBOM_05040 [Ceraceosorus bombacis]|uniref:INO80 complex subunit F domain-containing protein n=1 Tax=Ceraceosorus bombacis TaxID=401625 RepID=A0A0P1BII9_9BASI|nr:hypothetical protein CBOM_05040 [Ceraceosorus bombacis]